ncbi:MAG: bifunctional phosphoribosyl-AMP cyclohydrolase/phosphoribosyl-ATP diphosphatase HisIE [Lachnospiraceae bacterium]|nr:bifunctional phosphoribosyl-AMP cyclohydrolase/phosphoribosyl-ATP diphosphatase HisIE [Lachnospiraceae bacterium]
MNKVKKKIIPSIYLSAGKPVRSREDRSFLDKSALELTEEFNINGADAILVIDLSNNDEEHELNLDVMKAVCEKAETDVYGGGNVKRMEDIKKILYAGCVKAVLDYDLLSNVEITKEVSLKFGKEKLIAGASVIDNIKSSTELIKEYISEILCFDTPMVKEISGVLDLPYICQVEKADLKKILEYLSAENMAGITGNVINDNLSQINDIKKLCKDSGYEINELTPAFTFEDLKLNSDGLIPVIVQDYKTREVLMLAYMNRESYNLTLSTGKMHYFSRSRQSLWLKGETSGHFQYVKTLKLDCDNDTILALVSQTGAACHTGNRSCFYRDIAGIERAVQENPLEVFEKVSAVIKDRRINPKEGSYTNYLFDKGIDKILKKLGEEACEIVIASKNVNSNEVKYEICDFLYHMMVLMEVKDVTWGEIASELSKRE